MSNLKINHPSLDMFSNVLCYMNSYLYISQCIYPIEKCWVYSSLLSAAKYVRYTTVYRIKYFR